MPLYDWTLADGLLGTYSSVSCCRNAGFEALEYGRGCPHLLTEVQAQSESNYVRAHARGNRHVDGAQGFTRGRLVVLMKLRAVDARCRCQEGKK